MQFWRKGREDPRILPNRNRDKGKPRQMLGDSGHGGPKNEERHRTTNIMLITLNCFIAVTPRFPKQGNNDNIIRVQHQRSITSTFQNYLNRI